MADVAGAGVVLVVLEVVLERLAQRRLHVRVAEGEELRLRLGVVLLVEQGDGVDEVRKAHRVRALGVADVAGGIPVFGGDLRPQVIGEALGQLGHAGLHHEVVGHLVLVGVNKASLRGADHVVLGRVGHLDGLGVALALGHVLGLAGGGVDMHLLGHARRAHEAVVRGEVVQHVQPGVELVLEFVLKDEVFITGVCHSVFLPYSVSCLYSSGSRS